MGQSVVLLLAVVVLLAGSGVHADRWSDRDWRTLTTSERQQMMRERSQAMGSGVNASGALATEAGKSADTDWTEMNEAQRRAWLAKRGGARSAATSDADAREDQRRIRVYQGVTTR